MDENDEPTAMNGGELVYRATSPEQMQFRQEGDAPATLEGRMMPYDEWTEVNSKIEGHFMERFAPGALSKTISESASRIRMLFEHGMDSVLGRQTIAAIEGMRDEPDGAYYRASLLDGLPPLLMAGLRLGQYGSSVRFGPMKWDRVRAPQRSEHNPEGIPEHTIREARVKEVSVVTFPQYAGATAHVRSVTDDVLERLLLFGPVPDLAARTEPQHSDTDESEDPAVVPSRSTQPSRDYLQPESEDTPWRL